MLVGAAAVARVPRRARPRRPPAPARRPAPTRSPSGSSRARTSPTTSRRRAAGAARPRRGPAAFSALAVTHADGRRWIAGRARRARRVRRRARARRRAVAHGRARELGTRRCAGRSPTTSATPRRRRSSRARCSRLPLRPLQAATDDGPPRARAADAQRPRRRRRAGRRGRDRRRGAERARDLQNTPANDITPTRWPTAREAGRAADGIEVDVLGEDEIRDAGMGAFAAVAQGSDEEPAADHARYEGARRAARCSARRQGRDVRLRRHLDQARGEDAGDEVRHVGRRGGDRGHRRDRASCGAPVRVLGVVGATENLPVRPRDQARRHRARAGRHDDRDQQHRRRGPPGAGRLPRPRDRRRAPSGSSTSRR